MSAHDFLVELGTEELPPKTLKNLGQAFLGGVEKGLKAAGLNYSSARIYAAPRRLAVLVEQLASQQPDRSVNLDGPPVQAAFDKEGNPTQAALGFAKKCGVDLAQKLGAVALHPEEAVEVIKERTRARMLDCSVEVVGSAATTRLALDLVGKQGTVSVIGAGLINFDFPLQSAFRRGLTFRASVSSVQRYLPLLTAESTVKAAP